MRYLPILLILSVGVIGVCYLSWLPTPNLGVYGILPRWLTRWTDSTANMNVRTAVPLGILGFLSGLWLLMSKRTCSSWLAVWLVLVAVVSIAEIGQLILPHRHFDWGDICWGSVGACIGLGLPGLVYLIENRRDIFK
ncbi:VanZ family protein [Fibrella aquatica]|uniref:VanZ family protein n=1 Tax=Fibrella aquatica TaxID=3242487 RepID=UPI0035208E27